MSTEKAILPADYKGRVGHLALCHEEEATLWLWWKPTLLDWPSPILWLYSPVVCKFSWPGDLWGIDASGDLILLECKKGGGPDPFKDFVDYTDKECAKRTDVKDLQPRWRKWWKAEISPQFKSGVEERPAGHTKGILPRSNKRMHIRRWKPLVDEIYVTIRSKDYENHVGKAFDERKRRGNPPPTFAGLVVMPKDPKDVPGFGKYKMREKLLEQGKKARLYTAEGIARTDGMVDIRVTSRD